MRKSLSQQVIDTCLSMNTEGINQRIAGNVSVRFEAGFLITPSGVPYDRIIPNDIVYVGMDGASDDPLKPSQIPSSLDISGIVLLFGGSIFFSTASFRSLG